MKLKSIVIPLNQMSRSGEKHAQDYNLILCILMALRATYFLSVIYGDPVVSNRILSVKSVEGIYIYIITRSALATSGGLPKILCKLSRNFVDSFGGGATF